MRKLHPLPIPPGWDPVYVSLKVRSTDLILLREYCVLNVPFFHGLKFQVLELKVMFDLLSYLFRVPF